MIGWIGTAEQTHAEWLIGFEREHSTTLNRMKEFTDKIDTWRPLRGSELRGLAKYLEVRSEFYKMYLDGAREFAVHGYYELLNKVSAARASMDEQARDYRKQAARVEEGY